MGERGYGDGWRGPRTSASVTGLLLAGVGVVAWADKRTSVPGAALTWYSLTSIYAALAVAVVPVAAMCLVLRLGPPSYAGRAVPELQARLRTLTASGSCVIVSAHRQCSVLALAALAGLVGEDTFERVALLTHGSPIGRTCYRIFPAHVAEPIWSVAEALTTDGIGRWHNLYRPTDPIGGAIAGEVDAAGGPLNGIPPESQHH